MKKIFLSILSMIVVFLGINIASADYIHTCGITVNEELKCWGDSSNGKINVPIGFKWKSFSIGGEHTCGITTTDELKCWGWNTNGQTNVPTGFKWKSVKLGTYNTCGLTTNDELKCWGNNTNNKNNVPIGFKWKSYQLGYSNTCGITINDELKCWGDNINRQLNIPIGFKWNQVGIGNQYICGITLDSELKCWGYKGNWQKQPPEGYKWRKIYSNQPFTCGITTTNELKCWGFSAYGQLDSPNGYIWKKISNFGTHTCGITITNELKCWGENTSGQSDVPVGFLWKDIYNGLYYSCGITTNDELKCWGDNYERQLNNIPVGYNWFKFIENEELENNLDFIQIPTPTNLKQYIKSPLLEREELQVGSKIGKFQSGSGVIFETEIDNPESKEFKIEVQIYEKLSGNTRTFKSSSIINTSGKKSFTIPLSKGDYTWKLRLEDTQSNTSDWVEFENNGTDIDFYIFEGFEPYPYGFSFPNSGISNGLLDGGIIGYNLSEDNTKLDFRYKNDGTKWEIFNYLFPESRFENKYKMFDIFESMGLDNKNPDVFYNGNCHGLSLISSTYKKDPLKINELSNDFYNIIGSGTIYDNISLSINGLGKWNKYDEKLKTILISQLAQYEPNFVFTEKYYRENKNPIDILNELKENPDKSYILSFGGAETENDKLQGHAVVPYRVEGNRIYIWDNNVPYPNYLHKGITYNAYEQYIEVYGDGKNDFKIKLYTDEAFGWTHFTDMSIVDLDLIYGKTENNAMGFNENDILYTLSGNSEILLKDDLGRISGYKDGQIYEEIPGTIFVRNYGVILDNIYKENTWKQIYLPQKLENLTIEINGKTEENYDLMIAGGDYYTKLEGITTSSGQTDVFNISRENIKIDLDNTKTNSGTYNILVDDFQNNGTGTVMLGNLETINGKQELDINWTEVLNNSDTAVIYSKDLDNDGIQETIENLKPILDYSIEPEILLGNISGKIGLYLPQEICKKIGNKNCNQIVKQLEKEILNKTTKLILEKQEEGEEEIEGNNKNKNKDKKQNKKGKDKNKEEKQYIELDNKGNYKIVDLEPGMYKLSLELKKGWTTKTPNTGYYILEITNGENYIDKDFQVINKLLEQLIKNLKIK